MYTYIYDIVNLLDISDCLPPAIKDRKGLAIPMVSDNIDTLQKVRYSVFFTFRMLAAIWLQSTVMSHSNTSLKVMPWI